MTIAVDVAVIGGGIAGVSVAYELAAARSVILLEAESQLAAHTTGRSAAAFVESYGADPVRPLTRASRAFFEGPPPALADGSLLHPRGLLWVGRPDQDSRLEAMAGRRVSVAEAVARVPALDIGYLGGAVWQPDLLDLDVAGTHQAFVRGLGQRGGQVLAGAPVTALRRSSGRWRVRAGNDEVWSSVVVNATGAWGDEVARLADVSPLGLEPRRRTAFMVAGEEAWSGWPMVIDADEAFYFKPDGPQLLCSPADQTPAPPGDARPAEADIALAIERINTATTLGIRSVRSAWAGLRTFTLDGAMAIGPDPSEPSFVWLVGQGGTGIQTAPAAARLAAALTEGADVPADLVAAGVNVASLDPTRFA